MNIRDRASGSMPGAIRDFLGAGACETEETKNNNNNKTHGERSWLPVWLFTQHHTLWQSGQIRVCLTNLPGQSIRSPYFLPPKDECTSECSTDFSFTTVIITCKSAPSELQGCLMYIEREKFCTMGNVFESVWGTALCCHTLSPKCIEVQH